MEYASLGLFTAFAAENQLLSDYLSHEYGEIAYRFVIALPASELEKSDDELTSDLVARIRPTNRLQISPPKSGRREAGTHRPDKCAGFRIATVRQYIYFEISGDPHLLTFWPDATSTDVQPLDSELQTDQPNRDEATYDFAVEVDKHERRLNNSRWRLAISESGSTVLCVFIDLSEAEQDLVAEGSLDLHEKGLEFHRYATRIVEAIQNQADSYFSKDLRESIDRYITARRRRVRNEDAMTRSLSWPKEWEQQDVFLEDQPRASEPTPKRSSNVDTAPQSDLDVSHRSRLSPASFEIILRTVRTWADAVERTPGAFATLKEDHLSDILCATLNATLPGANREVYTRGGRADIVIRADILDEGRGPAVVYVCESKWWTSKPRASAALDQLFRYLTEADLVGTLLFFIDTQSSVRARKAIIQALEARQDFVRFSGEIVAGWPLLTFTRRNTEQRICVAFVHVPSH